MWYGKIAIILFIFSASLQFSMYFVNTGFNNATIANNYNFTTVSGMTLNFTSITHFTGGRDPNPLLYFGDFLIGLTTLFNILAGVPIVNMLSGIIVPSGFDLSTITLLIELLYGTSSAVLWVYVVANRSI